MKRLMMVLLLMCIPVLGFGEFVTNLQLSTAFDGYNDVRSPGDKGTLFSISDQLFYEAALSPRLELGYYYGNHYFGVMGSLLRMKYSGKIEGDILFEGKTFTKESFVNVNYRFDSYRIYYRYSFLKNDMMRLEGGVAIKMRDASIALESGNVKAEKSNIGFVPLLTVRYELFLSDMFSFLIQGDGLAAPQGRAEDFLFALLLKSDRFTTQFGYRFLEGGGDNKEVYTFAMFHYLALGIDYRF